MPSQRAPAAGALADFRLSDVSGRPFELYGNSAKKAVVIVSFGVDCPIVQKGASAMRQLQKRFAADVEFVGLDANLGDTREAVRKEAADFGIPWPILMDESQLVAKKLSITRTAEAVVVDTRKWQIVYRGAVDDRLEYGADKGAARHHYLQDALDAVLKGEPPPVPETHAKGCAITFRDDKDALAPR